MSTVVKDLGPVTAYAYAVAGGYTGTEEEFTELLGDLAATVADLESLTVTVTTLTPGSSATASYEDGVLALGIPQGAKGDTGTAATIAVGTVTTVAPTQNASVTNTGSSSAAVFAFSIPRGDGVATVTKTGTSGNVDTYTMTSDRGVTLGTFTVTNGNVSSVNGKTGAVVLDAGDLEFDSSETYTSGSVGEAVSELKSQIDDLLDTELQITSVNKLNANSAIGKTASQINGSKFYLGLEKKLSDYSDATAVIVFCRTTTDSTSGLTAQWLYDDDTVSSSYVTLNSSYVYASIANKDKIVGIKFTTYSVGASLVISKLGVKFNANTSTDDEDAYAEGYISERLNSIEERLDYQNIYIYDPDDAIELTTGDGVMSTSGEYNTSVAPFKHATGTVTPGTPYKISGRTFGASYPVYLWLNSSDSVIGYGTATDASDITEIGLAPTGAAKVVINIYNGHNTPVAIPGTITSTQNYVDNLISNTEKKYWTGKKIVWFGTSIPAGVINEGQQEGEGSYPSRIGEMLGATVYNESIGGSAVRAGDEHAISADDPMGYGGMSAPGLMLSLSLSSSEKQSIFDNWDTKWKDIITYNQNLINVTDPTYTNMYKNSSWDILLAKYLTGGSVGQCDLYVFDHGFNEGVYSNGYEGLADVPATADDRTYFIGAMTFLIGKILADNPKAQICFIGHWSNDRGTGNNSTELVAQAQEKLNEVWKFPLFKTWENIGWSSNEITSGGTTKAVCLFWCPDGVHPASDTSGDALKHYAEVLFPFIRDVR